MQPGVASAETYLPDPCVRFRPNQAPEPIMAINKLLEVMAQQKASDLFISVGSPVQIKIHGAMHALTAPDKRLTPQQAEALLRTAINDQQWKRFQDENELNIGYGLKDVGSFRISLFRQRGTAAAVIRYIPGDIPEFDTLGMPAVLKELILQPRGLFLMVGATGVGKTTTLASLIDYRNAHCTGHILTLEDPIEFVFRNQLSIVNQRQIGSDTRDLHTALKSALRQAPDCILIGEIRDIEAMAAAIAYAQSGHLVLATLHANNAAHALNRILSFYAPENRAALLADLSTTLKCIVSQRLLATVEGGRVPAAEVMINTNHVAELIAAGRLSEIPDAINNSLAAGSQSFDRSLTALLRAGRITKEDALQHSDSPTNLLWLLDNYTEEVPAADAGQGDGKLELPGLLAQQAADFSRQRGPATRGPQFSRPTLADMDDAHGAPAGTAPGASQLGTPPGAGALATQGPDTLIRPPSPQPPASAAATAAAAAAGTAAQHGTGGPASQIFPPTATQPPATQSPAPAVASQAPVSGIFSTVPPINTAKHGTLPPGTGGAGVPAGGHPSTSPGQPGTGPQGGNAGAAGGPSAPPPSQGAPFAEFMIRLDE